MAEGSYPFFRKPPLTNVYLPFLKFRPTLPPIPLKHIFCCFIGWLIQLCPSSKDRCSAGGISYLKNQYYFLVALENDWYLFLVSLVLTVRLVDDTFYVTFARFFVLCSYTIITLITITSITYYITEWINHWYRQFTWDCTWDLRWLCFSKITHMQNSHICCLDSK